MSIRDIASTALIAAALFTTQSASAAEVQFFKKHSEVAASQAKTNGSLATRMTIRAEATQQPTHYPQ